MNDYQKEKLEKARALCSIIRGLGFNAQVHEEKDEEPRILIDGAYEVHKGYDENIRISRYPYMRFDNISSHTAGEVSAKYKLGNMKVPTAKKIQERMEAVDNERLELIKLADDARAKHLAFLDSLKGFEVSYSYEDYKTKEKITGGEIIKNGLQFHFELGNDGYISKKITVHYSVNSTLEEFNALSSNKWIKAEEA